MQLQLYVCYVHVHEINVMYLNVNIQICLCICESMSAISMCTSFYTVIVILFSKCNVPFNLIQRHRARSSTRTTTAINKHKIKNFTNYFCQFVYMMYTHMHIHIYWHKKFCFPMNNNYFIHTYMHCIYYSFSF